MKRFIIIMILAISSSTAMWAQSGLNINQLFDGRYKQSKNATEVVVQGSRAEDMGMQLYRSIVVTNSASDVQTIERLVRSDGAKATSKEVESRKGHIYYGFYRFSPVKDSDYNRYVLYLNQSLANKQPSNKVTLIYIESEHGSTWIKKLIGGAK